MHLWVLLMGLLCFLPAEAQIKYSILQGVTSPSVTHFTVVAPSNETLRFDVVELSEGHLHEPAQIDLLHPENSAWSVYRLRFEGLDRRLSYQLQARNLANRITDQRLFKTLDVSNQAARVALVSAPAGEFNWESLKKIEARPDLVFLIGPALHPVTPDWEGYVALLQNTGLTQFERLIPVMTVGAQQEFLTQLQFFPPVHIEGFTQTLPGTSQQFQAFGRNFVLLEGYAHTNVSDAWMSTNARDGHNLIITGSAPANGNASWSFELAAFSERLRRANADKNASFTFANAEIRIIEFDSLRPVVQSLGGGDIHRSSRQLLMDFDTRLEIFGFKTRLLNAAGEPVLEQLISVGRACAASLTVERPNP